jgi:hypothetical protein
MRVLLYVSESVVVVVLEEFGAAQTLRFRGPIFRL